MKRPILYSTAAVIAMMGGLSAPQANATPAKAPTGTTCYISSFYSFDACTASCTIQIFKNNTPDAPGNTIYTTTVSADGVEHCGYLTSQLKTRAMNAFGCYAGSSGGGGGC